MKLYFGKLPGQMEFNNILFHRVEVTSKYCQICQSRPLLGHIWIYRWNFAAIQVRLETIHCKLFNIICQTR